MLPIDLLDKHLDNIAVRLRPTKPFTPNDFPAVKQIEWAIKDKPVEYKYHFDSTGMPIGYAVGDVNSVDGEFFDEAREGLSNQARAFYRSFDAPRSFGTHNHPTGYIADYRDTPVGERYSPLSLADYRNALEDGVGIRAVNSEYNGGQVYDFQPGAATVEGVREIVRSQPNGFHRDIPAFESAMQQGKYWQPDEYGDEYPVQLNEFNKPTIKTYSLTEPIDTPMMMSDSFRFR